MSALRRLAAPAILLMAALAFFLPLMATGQLLAPGDGIAQNFPARVLVAKSLLAGELPFWNPYNFGGAPLLAAIQPGVFFPGNWTFLFLPPVVAMHLTVLLAYGCAGIGAYGFARAIALPRAAALVAGLAYMLGGFLVLNQQHIMMVQVAALTPLVLWAIERFARTGRPRYPWLGTLLVALQILAGHPQMTAYGLVIALVYGLWRGLALPRALWWPYAGQLAAMFGLGVALCLAQLLPTIDFIRLSQRDAIPFARLVADTPPLLGLPGMLFPSFLGSRSPSDFLSAPLWPPGPWRWWLQGYLGLGTILLATLAIHRGPHQRHVRFWGPLALVSLLLAMGQQTPLYSLFAMLPVLNQMPYPHRHLVELNLAVAMLAALGLGAFMQADPKARLRSLAVGAGVVGVALAAVLAAVAFFGPGYAARTQPLLPPGIDLAATLSLLQPTFWLPVLLLGLTSLLLWGWARRPSRLWLGALLLLLGLDLGIAGYHNGYWQVSPEAPRLGATGEVEGRVLSVPVQPYPYFRSLAYLEAIAAPGVASLDGVASANGYDAFLYKRHGRLLSMNSAGQVLDGALWRPEHHALDLLATSQVRLDAKLLAQPAWQDRLAAPRWKKIGEAGGVVVYENARALPRAWRALEVVQLSPEAVDAKVTGEAAFDPRQTALVESAVAPRAFGPGTATAETVSLNRIRLETEGDGPGFVVVSESYDPGWRAFSSGRELPVHRTNALLLGVAVPAGEQTVELRYEPRLWRAGLLGSTLALFALAAWGTLGARRKRPDWAFEERRR